MKKIKLNIVALLTFCLVTTVMVLGATPLSASSDPANAPADWAFDASSVGLNDALVEKYPQLDTNKDGFISISAANSYTGEINLESKGIEGTLTGIENFTNIVSLKLRGNYFSGYVPENLDNMVNLRVLDLEINQLSGEFPTSILHMPNLTRLYLGANNFSGELPENIGNLTNLQSLSLYMNDFSGEIPEQFGNLINLNELELRNNQFSGELPESIRNLTKLSSLDLQDNQFSGEVLETLTNLTNLTTLRLSSNQFSGEVPESIGNLVNLQYLYLGNNQFSGEIPESMGNLVNLRYLSLGSNQFSGEILDKLMNFTALYALYLNNNQFSGEIPSSIGNITGLQFLHLNENQFSGKVPESIGNLVKLKYLYLNNNQFSGEIPSSIGNITGLNFLQLHENQFRGEIPSSLTNFSNIMTLTLSGNHLTSLHQDSYEYIAQKGSTHTQRAQQTIESKGKVGQDFGFEGFPIYEQLLTYEIDVAYTLVAPDGTERSILPTIVNGEVTIHGSDITEAGTYQLVANVDRYAKVFASSEFTTTFTVENASNEIAFLDSQADGMDSTCTSTKITLMLSEDVEDLALEDIRIVDAKRADVTIEKEALTSLGDGVYELAIRGDWAQGHDVDVVLAKAGVQFSPDTNTTTLHREQDGIEGIEGEDDDQPNGETIAGEGEVDAPQTGDHTNKMLFIVTMFLAGGYLVIRRKKVQ